MTKTSSIAAIALLSSCSVDAFTMSPMAGSKLSTLRNRHVDVLKMSAAEDEISKLRAQAAKMREEAQSLEKVRMNKMCTKSMNNEVQMTDHNSAQTL